MAVAADIPRKFNLSIEFNEIPILIPITISKPHLWYSLSWIKNNLTPLSFGLTLRTDYFFFISFFIHISIHKLPTIDLNQLDQPTAEQLVWCHNSRNTKWWWSNSRTVLSKPWSRIKPRIKVCEDLFRYRSGSNKPQRKMVEIRIPHLDELWDDDHAFAASFYRSSRGLLELKSVYHFPR